MQLECQRRIGVGILAACGKQHQPAIFERRLGRWSSLLIERQARHSIWKDNRAVDDDQRQRLRRAGGRVSCLFAHWVPHLLDKAESKFRCWYYGTFIPLCQ